MKKFDYQAPKMVAIKLNRKPTLLQGSCTTQCDTDSSSGGSCVVD